MSTLNIKKNYLTNNRCYQRGDTCTKIGIQIHTIGTGQGTAQSVADYWNQSAVSACVHYVCDADVPGNVLQLLPETYRSWADAGWGNNNLISIEICESDYISYTGGANYDVNKEEKFKTDIQRGYNTAIMDADITGPSIPKMLGVHGQVVGTEEGMIPLEAENGIKVMSVNLLLDNEEDPVIWRGPVIAGVVKQFWNETVWGDVDYLFVDMPPGTGDVPLTVFQSLPVDGIVIVTSPQELVQMIVKKAYNMAEMMHVPVLGLIENFSYLKCPDCGKEIKLFGESHIEDVAAELTLPVFGKIPLDPAFAEKADEGKFYETENPYLQTAVRALSAMSRIM